MHTIIHAQQAQHQLKQAGRAPLRRPTSRQRSMMAASLGAQKAGAGWPPSRPWLAA